MATDAETLEFVTRAFASEGRPERFTNHMHCDECGEHDETLRSRDIESISQEELGTEAWDPIAFITPEGFRYYMPALARLALQPPVPKWGWYGPQLFTHLRMDGLRNVRWASCTREQRQAVRALLEHIFDTRAGEIEAANYVREFLDALDVWSDMG